MPHRDEFGTFDIDTEDLCDTYSAHIYSTLECPVCGVPWGTGACFRCIAVAADTFAMEDYLDGL